MHKRTLSRMIIALPLLAFAVFSSSLIAAEPMAQTSPTTPVAPDAEATEEVQAPADYGAPEVTYEMFVAIDLASLPQERLADGGFVVGNPDAPVTLIEFSDFACPFCQIYQPVVAAFMIEYVVTGQAKFEYRVLPTAGGEFSYFTGMLLECADEQRAGAFWEGYHLMWQYAFTHYYEQRDSLAARFTNDAGLDFAAMRPCVEGLIADGSAQVAADAMLAADYGISSTPTFMFRVGDSSPQLITDGTTTYFGGGVPYPVLVSLVEANAIPEETAEPT